MAWPSRPPPTLRPICVRLTTPTYLTVHKLQIASLPLSRPRWLIFQWLESNFLHKMKIMKGSYQKISFHSTWKKTFSKLRICKMPPTLMVSTMRPVHRVIPLPPSLDVIYLRPLNLISIFLCGNARIWKNIKSQWIWAFSALRAENCTHFLGGWGRSDPPRTTKG